MRFTLAILLAMLPLLLAEAASRFGHMKPEYSRKLAHVLSSLVVCIFPLIISLEQIAIIGGLFFLALASTRYLRIWKSLYGIKRKSLGELWFPLGVSAASLLATGNRQFICAMLIMGLSDTAAALIGQRYGKRYVTVPFQKSIEGSATFFIITIVLITSVLSFFSVPYTLLVAGLLTLIEFVSPYGSDNLTVPLLSVIFTNIYT